MVPGYKHILYFGLTNREGETLHFNHIKNFIHFNSGITEYNLALTTGVYNGVEEECVVFTTIQGSHLIPCLELLAELYCKQFNRRCALYEVSEVKYAHMG